MALTANFKNVSSILKLGNSERSYSPWLCSSRTTLMQQNALNSAPVQVCEDDWVHTKLHLRKKKRFRSDLITLSVRANQVRSLLMCTPRNLEQLILSTTFPLICMMCMGACSPSCNPQSSPLSCREVVVLTPCCQGTDLLSIG